MQEAPSPEDRLLGGLLQGLVHWPGTVEASLSALEPRQFGAEANRIVFEAIDALRRDGSPVDLVTVYERLRRVGRVEHAGGAIRLAELWECACHPADLPALAGSLIRQDRPEPPPQVLTQEPEPPCDFPEGDTSFDFGANAASEAGE